jgi:hypothetical protein
MPASFMETEDPVGSLLRPAVQRSPEPVKRAAAIDALAGVRRVQLMGGRRQPIRRVRRGECSGWWATWSGTA